MTKTMTKLASLGEVAENASEGTWVQSSSFLVCTKEEGRVLAQCQPLGVYALDVSALQATHNAAHIATFHPKITLDMLKLLGLADQLAMSLQMALPSDVTSSSLSQYKHLRKIFEDSQ